MGSEAAGGTESGVKRAGGEGGDAQRGSGGKGGHGGGGRNEGRRETVGVGRGVVGIREGYGGGWGQWGDGGEWAVMGGGGCGGRSGG